eukprot:scaffold48671_cov71-Phaeocystis_antarctica.AAC.2
MGAESFERARPRRRVGREGREAAGGAATSGIYCWCERRGYTDCLGLPCRKAWCGRAGRLG